MFGREQIPLLKDKIVKLSQQVESIKENLRGLINHGKDAAKGIPDYFNGQLQSNSQKSLRILEQQSIHRYFPWDSPSWQDWTPPMYDSENGTGDTFTPDTIRIGDLVETRGNLGFSVPAMIPFIGQNHTVIIKTSPAQYDAGLSLLQSLLVRTALMLPHQTTYTLLDPARLGQSFPMRGSLSHVQNSAQDVRRDLDEVIERIRRLNTSFLEHKAFHEVELDLRVNERYNFVFVADFPNRYDFRAIEALQSVTENGPRAGTYVFIHYNTEHELPRDVSMSDFKNATYIDLTSKPQFNNFELKIDQSPDSGAQAMLFKKLEAAKPPERKIEFSDIVGLDEGSWWQESAKDLIQTPIGASGATGQLNVWLGQSQDSGVVAHGVLGGATGSGKSNLYHVLILGLAMRYSPDELRFFLIDGKDGVEFQPYRNLPHAEVVSLKSSPQLSRSVLQEITEEMERRNEVFTQVGVANLSQYRQQGQPKGKLPRILLLVDEYQELFEGDKDGLASQYLEQIARQGRSAGIHMLLGAQGFVGVQGMVNRNAIFGNIHLRMAMQMPASDVQALTEFQRDGKRLIMTCDLPGKIVTNHVSGNDGDGANQLGKVAFLTTEMRNQLIDQLAHKANADLEPEDNPVTIVFDGKAQPNFIDNQLVEYLMQHKHWLTQENMQTVARRPLHDEGFDVPDWFSAEGPMIAWVGQSFTVRGQTAIVFRRRIGENAMIIGSQNAVRYGMLSTIISSLALNKRPDDVEFVIYDRSVPGTDWSNTLTKVADTILKPNGYKCLLYRENREAESLLDSIIEKLNERRDMDEANLVNEPAVFVVMSELDRVDDLRRPPGAYMMSESPLGDKLNRIIQEGPAMGIHTVMSFANVRPMTHVVDERHGLTNFRHRIALQMGEDESLTFVRSRNAAILQNEGNLPIVALYMDTENDTSTRFKPYSIEITSSTSIDFYEQMEQVGKKLAVWGSAS
ncbi:MAG: DNA translocase FtsK [Anaerolineae bacterium]|nr:DNA translocase FtsK [Anaerolineae bacterium]